MRIFIFTLFLYLVLVSGIKEYDVSESSDESAEDNDFVPDVETTIDFRGTVRKQFALELALESEGQNMVCSPLSAILPLSKLILGTKNKSQIERMLLDAVGLKSRSLVKPANRQIIKDLEYLGGVEISLASRMYLSYKKRLAKRFKRKSQRIFGSSVELVDFERRKETAASINDWIYEHTNKRIKNMLTHRDIDPNGSLTLVNAIYFLGKWKVPFNRARMRPFYGTNGEKFNAPLMSKSGSYNYISNEELNVQILEIPYVGEESFMIILLPFTKSGLPILLRTLKLSPGLLNEALKKMKTATVDVTIPRFKIDTTLDLVPYYKKMNLSRLFANQSGLDYIIRNGTVSITNAKQRAYIEVTERGTEAAAATTIAGLQASMYQPIMFLADHPFLFYVIGKRDQLFAGVVNNPELN